MFLSIILLFLTFRTGPTLGYFFVFHFISTIFLLNVGTVPIVWYLFFILLLSYVSVLENTMWYARSIGQRVDVGILGVVTVNSAVDCARRCHQHINCNNFNFRRINMTFLDFSNWSDIGVFLFFHFISTIFLLNVGTVPIVWYLFFI